MAVAVPLPPHGKSRDGSLGFICGSLGRGPALEQCCPTRAKSAPAWSLLPVPGTAVSASPAQEDHDTNSPGTARDGCQPCLCSGTGLGGSRAPLSCLRPRQDMIPGLPERHLPSAPLRERSQRPPPAQWLLSGPAAATKGPLWARGSRGQSSGVLLAGPRPVPARPRCAPAPLPPGESLGWMGSEEFQETGSGEEGEERSGEGSAPGRARAVLAAGSSALGPGPLPPWAQLHLPPSVYVGATAGRKMRLQGRGHAGLDVDFHREMPSGLLTLGGYHKATGNPQGRGGWVFQEIHVSPLPVTPLQSCTRSRGAAGSPCSRLSDLDKKLFGFLQGCSVSPAEWQGGGRRSL